MGVHVATVKAGLEEEGEVNMEVMASEVTERVAFEVRGGGRGGGRRGYSGPPGGGQQGIRVFP